MPTYEYRCPKGHDFEHFFGRISESTSTFPCPACGELAERRISGGAGLVFKGSGFYLTDYGKNAHRGAAPAGAGKGEGAQGDGAKGDGAKGDGAKGDGAKGDGAKSGGDGGGSNGDSKPAGDAKAAGAAEAKPPAKAESKPAAKPSGSGE